MPHLDHYGAFESTRIHGCSTDILDTTRHTELWRSDLEMLLGAGIRRVRYSAPWHKVEPQPGVFHFEWLDGPMAFLRENGMQPILDPLHHTSFPDWLIGGFANAHFPDLYRRYIERLARRYPFVEQYTVFNEPLPTTLFCSLTGMWYPHLRSDRDFVGMAMNVGRAICLASAALRRENPDVELVHIDTCEHHRTVDLESADWVRFANRRRFVMHDLILGRIGAEHPLLRYLRANGFTRRQQAWFEENAQPFDILGLDYYCHSEMEWKWNPERGGGDIRYPARRPLGFAEIAKTYAERYGVPVILGETNIRGTVADRLSWLRFMEEQCAGAVQAGVDLRGFCWYPSVDSTDWSNCCTRLTHEVDPQGIWWLDGDRLARHESELSACYAALASGQIGWKELPYYRFGPPLDRDLAGYLRLMRHWTGWLEQALVAAA
jgi:beta-glucosidase/6-phospho-beta-glucosidase/beta-galactosidase